MHLTSWHLIGCVLGLAACGNDVSTSSTGTGGSAQTGSSTTATHSSTTGSGSPTSTATTTTTHAATTASGTASTSTATAGSTSSSASTGSAMATAECSTASDCSLENDCCACAGYPKVDPAPACTTPNCLISVCTADAYSTTLACVLGRCVAGFDCDTSQVACATAQPICPAGQTNSVKGNCWGPCVPADQCAKVNACSQCAANQACVFYGGGLKSYHCVDIPTVCGGNGTCACMGQSLCGGVPCADGPAANQMTCQAP